MEVIESHADLWKARAAMPSPFGLVPTMGFLHEGHLSLVRRAKQECASVGVSIFVNPTQFGPEEDLDTYPVDLERDLELLERETVDCVWLPTREEMYPTGFQTWVTVEALTKPLEGKERPGHFRGVTTVVAKLFNAFRPDRAYFGQKDAQQALVITRMVKDLSYPIEMIICPTVREPDGLAMSSRNNYLSQEGRAAAPILQRALQTAKNQFVQGQRDADQLRETVWQVLGQEPRAVPQYVSVADPETLEELSGEVEHALISLAIFIGETRLIDNILLPQPV